MEKVEITIEDLALAASCIKAQVSRKEQRLRNFVKKIEKAESEGQTGMYRMRRGKLQRELYISKLKAIADYFEQAFMEKSLST